MRNMYLSAPLPFVGQKRMFAKEFIKVLDRFPDSTVFVDLFGGSGLLSHITKRVRPDAVVVYNDFDNYRQRLDNIPNTNQLLADLRRITAELPRKKRITGEARERILARIEKEEKEHGYVDYITLSSSLLFSMKYVLNLDNMRKETFYNTIHRTDYSDAKDYLEELMPIANLGSKGFLRKGVLSPILVCNKDSVQEVCVVRLASSSNAYIGMILYVYWGGSTGLFFINSKTGNSYIIRKVNGSMISEIEFKRKNDHLFVRSKTNTASFRVSALFLDTTGVDLSLSMNIVDENLDDAEDIEIL